MYTAKYNVADPLPVTSHLCVTLQSVCRRQPGPDASFELFATLRFADFEVGTTQSVPGACDIT